MNSYAINVQYRPRRVTAGINYLELMICLLQICSVEEYRVEILYIPRLETSEVDNLYAVDNHSIRPKAISKPSIDPGDTLIGG